MRASASGYGRFATLSGDAAGQIRSLNAGGWVGDEGDLFRSQAGVLPPLLDAATQAFGQAAAALDGFADALAQGRSQMSSERALAEPAWSQLKSASLSLRAATDPNAMSGLTGLGLTAAASPAQQLAVVAAHDQQVVDFRQAADGAQSTWGGHVATANAITARVRAAAAEAGHQIRAAGQLSPTANQNWFEDKLDKAGNWVDGANGVRSWIGDHAGFLRGAGEWIAGFGQGLMAAGAAVAAVSAAAGFLSFGIGWLGEIPAGAMIMVGGMMWGGGDAMQTAADWGEGKIAGRQLVVDVAINAALTGLTLGIGKAVTKLAPKAIEKFIPGFATKTSEWLDRIRKGRPAAPVPKVTPHPVGVVNADAVGPSNIWGAVSGVSRDAPAHYTFKNPGVARAGEPQPVRSELALVGRADYPAGSREHMVQAWRDYVDGKRAAGQTPQQFDSWRNGYIANQGNVYKGAAFESAFRHEHGFDKAEGWTFDQKQNHVKVPGMAGPSGVRDFDILNRFEGGAFELKSNGSMPEAQIAKDAVLIRDGLDVHYVFGQEPSKSTLGLFAKYGISPDRWQVWYATGTPVG